MCSKITDLRKRDITGFEELKFVIFIIIKNATGPNHQEKILNI